MESMEERLLRYRRQQVKEQLFKFNFSFEPVKKLFSVAAYSPSVEQAEQIDCQNYRRMNVYHESSEEEQEDEQLINNNEEFNITTKICLAIVWLFALHIFIIIEFALVYLCVSLLVFICLNTRTKRTSREVSAYSVFNKNCAPIQGTLDASQIDSEIRGGFSTFHSVSI